VTLKKKQKANHERSKSRRKRGKAVCDKGDRNYRRIANGQDASRIREKNARLGQRKEGLGKHQIGLSERGRTGALSQRKAGCHSAETARTIIRHSRKGKKNSERISQKAQGRNTGEVTEARKGGKEPRNEMRQPGGVSLKGGHASEHRAHLFCSKPPRVPGKRRTSKRQQKKLRKRDLSKAKKETGSLLRGKNRKSSDDSLKSLVTKASNDPALHEER